MVLSLFGGTGNHGGNGSGDGGGDGSGGSGVGCTCRAVPFVGVNVGVGIGVGDALLNWNGMGWIVLDLLDLVGLDFAARNCHQEIRK